jgi:hypothetical protein
MGHTQSIGWGKSSVFVLLLMAVLTSAKLASAKDVGDPVLGYTAKIPDTWIQYKSSWIENMQVRLFGSSSSNVQIVDGFGSSMPLAGGPAIYPYALVQKIYYPNGDEISSISEEELKKMVAAMNGQTPADIQKTAPSSVAGLFQPGKINISYTTAPPGWQLELTMTVKTVGPVHGKGVALFGKKQAVQFMVYDLDARWPSDMPQFSTMLSSFQLDADHQVPLGAASGLEGATMDSVWMHLIEFVVIGGLFAMFIAWKFKKA